MSMAEPYTVSFERPTTGQADTAFLEHVKATVRRICQAEAIVLEVCKSATGFSPFPPPHGADDPLEAALALFLAEDGAARSAETRAHRQPEGAEFVFLRLPLIARGETVGKLALALDRAVWEARDGQDICVEVSRLVSLLIKDYCSKLDLEVDLIDMQRRFDRMTRKAETDPLTLCENKSSFEKKAQARLQSGAGPMALLVIDVDNFKTVNDIFGHQFGDNYLRSIAETLRSTFPRGTLIGRIGGDEFTALVELPSSTRAFLDSLVKQMRASLQRGAAVLGKPELGRVSIGIGIFPMQALDYQGLFGAADAALYAAKRSGRNTTMIYDGKVKTFARHRDFATYFLRALERDEIVAHFQPIVALETGERAGYEVLARWLDPSKGLITPQSFEPAFHDYRMAAALTARIVTNALEMAAGLPGLRGAEGPDLWFNLTTFDLLNPEFVFDMQSALVRYGFGWDRIVVEVTERVMLGERSGQVYRSLDEVRRRGGRVAFDDFGTGHAGLLHVKDWPVDIIKIDRSFTGGIGGSERDQVMVKALVQIASTMGQDVVAEGIETPEQLAALRGLGCRYGQGYLFSEAMAGEALAGAPEAYLTGLAPQITSG